MLFLLIFCLLLLGYVTPQWMPYPFMFLSTFVWVVQVMTPETVEPVSMAMTQISVFTKDKCFNITQNFHLNKNEPKFECYFRTWSTKMNKLLHAVIYLGLFYRPAGLLWITYFINTSNCTILWLIYHVFWNTYESMMKSFIILDFFKLCLVDRR